MLAVEDLYDRICQGHIVPVSFRLGKRPAELQLQARRSLPDGSEELAYRVLGAELWCWLILKHDRDYGFLRWQPRLFAGESLHKPISRVRLLDLDSAHEQQTLYQIRGMSGGLIDHVKPGQQRFPPTGLLPWRRELGLMQRFRLDCGGCGKSSAQQTPLWHYNDNSGGIWFGPEWSGSWDLEVGRLPTSSHVQVGLPKLHFRMLQGEEIELPAMCLGSYQGDEALGENRLRRAIRDRFMARDQHGQVVTPPVCHQGLCGQEEYYNDVGIKAEMARAAEVGCEYYIFNAHWFIAPQQTGKHAGMLKMPWGDKPKEVWFQLMGDYEPSPEKFPSGMRSLDSYVRSLGMKLGYWIDPRFGFDSHGLKDWPDAALAADPERLGAGRNFPSVDFCGAHLVDMARTAGRRWYGRLIDRIVTEWGGEWIWHDLNAWPRHSHWDETEEDDRRGLQELFYYQGLYQVFDEALQRHPQLRIEGCANGGTYIDLGMIRRNHSIWVNDFVGFEGAGQDYDIDVNRNLRSGALHFLPGALIQNSMYIPWAVTQRDELYDPIHYVSHFGGTLCFGQRMKCWKQSDVDEAKRCIAVYKRIRHLTNADYYQLAPMATTRADWDGWQFHDPEKGEGVVIVFRLNESESERDFNLPIIPSSCELLLGDADYQLQAAQLHIALATTRFAVIHYRS